VYHLAVALNRTVDCSNMNGDAVRAWQTRFLLEIR
jgi:hypothetical protein